MSKSTAVDPLATYKMPIFAGQVLVYGDVMLDRYWGGAVERISPEAPVPVVKIDNCSDHPGGAANVAVNVAKLGMDCHLWGITGADDNAQILRSQLKTADITSHLQADPSSKTITKLRVSSQSQQMMRLDFENSLAAVDQKKMLADFSGQLGNAKCVVLSDYAKGTLDQVQNIIAKAKSVRVPCLVDPKGDDFTRYRGATLLTPNYKEFTAVVGPCVNEVDIAQKGQQLLLDLDLQALLITRGAAGMTLLQRGADDSISVTNIATRAREVFDVSGAGDTVIAVLASSIASGENILMAARLANLAAGLAVSRLGPVALTVMELRRELQKVAMPDQAIMQLDNLLLAVNEAKAQGQRIVMTNGCFDLLHAGHVHYLEQARSLGDRLIVAVNDDASVSGLKGSTRPVQDLTARMSVLAGLRAVDYVVPFSESTPANLVEQILPDVLVKGGDYEIKDIVGHEVVLENGGEVKQLDFIPGCSTTDIINKIKQ